MTSSLVGSEMCIRDRLAHYYVCSDTWPRTWCACREMWPAALWACRACGAVSYTHLTLPTICSV
eukprot:12025472-Prorocentrum_lima.AAC.1